MSNIKRALVSLMRQPVKSSIFLILVFILGILISGAISVRHAILHTNQNLRRQMPAVAMVEYDFDFEAALVILEETGEWPMVEVDVLTREIIHEIGDLPQVRTFDYSINLSFDIVAENLDPWLSFAHNEIEHHYRMENGFGVELGISGVATVDFLDIRSNFIELIAGRHFTEEELTAESGDRFPVLLASGFAQTNGLTIGSGFDVRVLIRDKQILEDGRYELDWNSEPTLGAVFPLEVIGIFELIPPPLAEGSDFFEQFVHSSQESRRQHRMYVPNLIAQEILHELVSELPTVDLNDSFQNIFLLHDPLDFEDFAQAVQNMPGNWRAIDYSRGFGDISLAMIHLQDIADLILLMAIIATITMIGLLVLLFLNDRKHEMGVYLALGARKKGIVFQICTEVMILAFIGMTISLFVGNMMARNMTQEILRQELANPRHVNEIDHVHWLEELGYRFSMTHDDMLAAYEIRLGREEVVWFYIAGLGTVFVATILPIIKIVKTNPKKVLL